jgi:outer membrane protein OmpA-like peptidoglycan-associated protein
MKKTLTKLLCVTLLLAPLSTWANNCQSLYNKSLKAAPAEKSRLLEQALKLCPNHLDALNNLANLMEEQQKWSEAQLYYDRAIKANPDFARAYAGLGDVLMQRQDYQGAADAFDKFLEKAKGDPTLQQYVPHYRQRFKEAQDKITVSASKIYKKLSGEKSFGFKPEIDIPINFATNSYKVKGEALKACREMAKALRQLDKDGELKNSRIRIEGHTDSRGSAYMNQILSEKRANSVKNVLIKEFKVPASLFLKPIGWGEEKPFATNKTKHGRFLNRRVTLIRIDR